MRAVRPGNLLPVQGMDTSTTMTTKTKTETEGMVLPITPVNNADADADANTGAGAMTNHNEFDDMVIHENFTSLGGKLFAMVSYGIYH
jgi:hypothetical protein